MKFSNITKCFTLPTLSEVANIYNNDTSIVVNDISDDEIVIRDIINEKKKNFSNITKYFTLPTLSEVANIYNNNEIQTGIIIQEGIMVSGVN